MHMTDQHSTVTGRFNAAVLSLAILGGFLAGCSTPDAAPRVAKWEVFTRDFPSTSVYASNATAVRLDVRFLSAGGREMVVPARYLGGQTWQVRFVPNEVGRWTWKTESSDPANLGLHGVSGEFVCAVPSLVGRRSAPPLDDPEVRVPYVQAAFGNPASDLTEIGHLLSPSAQGTLTPLFETFAGLEAWRMRVASDVVAQPGGTDASRRIAALRSDTGDLLLAYTPGERSVAVALSAVPKGCRARWLNPRTGAVHAAVGVVSAQRIDFPTPEPGDWFLELTAK